MLPVVDIDDSVPGTDADSNEFTTRGDGDPESFLLLRRAANGVRLIPVNPATLWKSAATTIVLIVSFFIVLIIAIVVWFPRRINISSNNNHHDNNKTTDVQEKVTMGLIQCAVCVSVCP